jgi:16S rRNA G966 N2-methylase RsmD
MDKTPENPKKYKNLTQQKNLAWVLPRPKKDRYKGGMPLYCEEWLLALIKELLQKQDIKLMNLFCGMNRYGFRVDIKPEVKPDVCCDAHLLTQYISDKFDVILADPPYSNEEAKQLYNTPALHYKKWTYECEQLLKTGGVLIVYHKYLMPNPNKKKFRVIKRVFIGNRAYRLPRVAIFFQKHSE